MALTANFPDQFGSTALPRLKRGSKPKRRKKKKKKKRVRKGYV